VLSRRAFLGAAGGVAALGATGLVVERPSVRQWFADLADPDPAAPAPRRSPGPSRSGSFPSRACARDVGWQLSYPPGTRIGDRLPVALVLHGRGGDHRSAVTELRLDGYLADAVDGGTRPFVLAAVDGGDHSYWHRRRSGEDPQAMLTQEFVPLLTGLGLRTDRIGLFGWSMGGYGALLLAETVGAARIAAVAASSPALWQRAADRSSGSFDGAADFAAHDVFPRRDRLAGVPVRIACGTADPFYPAVRAFTPSVPVLVGTDFPAGGHTDAFWRRSAPAQLRFLGNALA
jgi:S-formylglutathione hydrolase FrmB